jgi:DNA modification methylase
MKIIQGDCIEGLRTLPDASVHCCVTSPPYWGLRDYGHDGQIGLEATPESYVARMVEVFREVRRVLRDDGTLWLNLGDTYANTPVGKFNGGGFTDVSAKTGGRDLSGVATSGSVNKWKASGLKQKDLCGIPWRVAFALQSDGWWLRQDIIWHKPNPMPESVRDRCTKAHEYVFLLTKSQRYYYDAEATSESLSGKPHAPGNKCSADGGHLRNDFGTDAMQRVWGASGRRNRRSVWTVTTKPYKGAHFATMPPDLVEPGIKAGTSEHGCCFACGSPYERVTERKRLKRDRPNAYTKRHGEAGTGNCVANDVAGVAVETVGWQPTCDCKDARIAPCVVLDPFAGSGTTLAVAAELGRDGVGCELNPEYIKLAEERIAKAKAKTPLFA